MILIVSVGLSTLHQPEFPSALRWNTMKTTCWDNEVFIELNSSLTSFESTKMISRIFVSGTSDAWNGYPLDFNRVHVCSNPYASKATWSTGFLMPSGTPLSFHNKNHCTFSIINPGSRKIKRPHEFLLKIKLLGLKTYCFFLPWGLDKDGIMYLNGHGLRHWNYLILQVTFLRPDFNVLMGYLYPPGASSSCISIRPV